MSPSGLQLSNRIMSMNINPESKTRYFDFLKYLDRQSKKSLIRDLTAAVETTVENESDIEHLFGAWEDTRTAEEIIHDLQTARIQNSDIHKLERNTY